MATEVLATIDAHSRLVAINAPEAQLLADLYQKKPDRTYRVKVTAATPRSMRQLRFYWATLDKTVDNSEFYTAAQTLHLFLKHRCGLYDKIAFHNGEVHIELNSIGVEKMDADAFNSYFNNVLRLITEEVCPGMDRQGLIREVERETGITYASLMAGK